jgi:hypothetical protein
VICFIRRHKNILATLALAALIPLIGFWWYRHRYPYGHSHCCILAVMFALEQYADDHDGFYPAGEANPEASLSLLHYGNYELGAEALRGKIVPVEIVEQIFDAGRLLGPESCGWHYVEGLTQNDDRRIAILWDKVGLGHNGERHGDGGREVLFVGGERRWIARADWAAFMQEQEELLANRDELSKTAGNVLVAKVKLPTGEVVDRFDSPYEIEEHHVSEGLTVDGRCRSGPRLTPRCLQWKGKHLLPSEGVKTFVLAFPEKRLRSKPVSVKAHNARASPNAIIFEMETAK